MSGKRSNNPEPASDAGPGATGNPLTWRGFVPAMASAVALGIIGLLGWAAGMPWLFPSLGPTVAIQTTSPHSPGARPWNVIGGHLIGIGAGFIALFVTGAIATPSVVVAQALSVPRVLAAMLAVFLSMLLQPMLKMQHPPAEATTLLIALGALPATSRGALVVVIGVLWVTVLGELAKRFAKPENLQT
ncbi:MAG: HPP family protein [Betaproteobacteria bacterium]